LIFHGESGRQGLNLQKLAEPDMSWIHIVKPVFALFSLYLGNLPRHRSSFSNFTGGSTDQIDPLSMLNDEGKRLFQLL
jgi:hypothetical protein